MYKNKKWTSLQNKNMKSVSLKAEKPILKSLNAVRAKFQIAKNRLDLSARDELQVDRNKEIRDTERKSSNNNIFFKTNEFKVMKISRSGPKLLNRLNFTFKETLRPVVIQNTSFN